MGPRVTFGHMLSELLIVILIVAGLATVALRYTTAVAVIGGVALVIFGLLTILREPGGNACPDRQRAAVVTANPYFAVFLQASQTRTSGSGG